MKKIAFILLLFVSTYSGAQTSYSIFEDIPITFYGLDFTHAKCVGSRKVPEATKIVNEYFVKWNDMFMVGKRKLDIGKPYKKHDVFYDTTTYQKNRSVDASKLIIEFPHEFTKKNVESFIEEYINQDKEGVGLIYLVEAINTTEKYLSVWVTFFKISTGEIILSEPVRSKGRGRKFSYYWNDAFIKLYEESGKEYKVWRKIYR